MKSGKTTKLYTVVDVVRKKLLFYEKQLNQTIKQEVGIRQLGKA